jgi:hypothetical protein
MHLHRIRDKESKDKSGPDQKKMTSPRSKAPDPAWI